MAQCLRGVPSHRMAGMWGQERHGELGQYPAFSHHPRRPQAVSSSTEHLEGMEAEGTRLYHRGFPGGAVVQNPPAN